jgi:hypothetical protein
MQANEAHLTGAELEAKLTTLNDAIKQTILKRCAHSLNI